MDAWILGECVHHDQPVVTSEVDGVVNMDAAPRFVGGDLRVRRLLRGEPLVLVAICAVSSDVFDIGINAWPVDSSAGQLLHSLHAEMPQVQDLEDLGLHSPWDHHSVPVENAAIR